MHDAATGVDRTGLHSVALCTWNVFPHAELHGYMVNAQVLAVWRQLQSVLFCDARRALSSSVTCPAWVCSGVLFSSESHASPALQDMSTEGEETIPE